MTWCGCAISRAGAVGLKVKTEERLAVPWDAEDLVDQVKALLPEGQAVALRDKGITELPLARLNARLASLRLCHSRQEIARPESLGDVHGRRWTGGAVRAV